jgi:hypothetical protein
MPSSDLHIGAKIREAADLIVAECDRNESDRVAEEYLMQERRRAALAPCIWDTFAGYQSRTRLGAPTAEYLEDIAVLFGGTMMEIYQSRYWSNGIVCVGFTGLVHHCWAINTDGQDRRTSLLKAISSGCDVPSNLIGYLNR